MIRSPKNLAVTMLAGIGQKIAQLDKILASPATPFLLLPPFALSYRPPAISNRNQVRRSV